MLVDNPLIYLTDVDATNVGNTTYTLSYTMTQPKHMYGFLFVVIPPGANIAGGTDYNSNVGNIEVPLYFLQYVIFGSGYTNIPTPTPTPTPATTPTPTPISLPPVTYGTKQMLLYLGLALTVVGAVWTVAIRKNINK